MVFKVKTCWQSVGLITDMVVLTEKHIDMALAWSCQREQWSHIWDLEGLECICVV